jgi:hypothetical protein
MVDNAILLNSTFLFSKSFLLYTDPGAGSSVWQLLLASFIGGAFYVRLFARRFKQRVGGWKKAESNSDLVESGTSQPAE